MIEIRTATVEDGEAVAQIRYEASKAAFSNYVTESTLNQQTDVVNYQKAFTRALADKSLQFLVGMHDGKRKGMLSWRVMDAFGEIVSVHTMSECWGAGLGASLMQAAFVKMQEIGLKGVYLWTFQENMRARHFYEKYGFRADGEMKVSQYDGAIEVRYVLMFDNN